MTASTRLPRLPRGAAASDPASPRGGGPSTRWLLPTVSRDRNRPRGLRAVRSGRTGGIGAPEHSEVAAGKPGHP